MNKNVYFIFELEGNVYLNSGNRNLKVHIQSINLYSFKNFIYIKVQNLSVKKNQRVIKTKIVFNLYNFRKCYDWKLSFQD